MTEKRSTKKQKELLNFVDSFIQGNGYGPSYREIMRALGYRSVATVAEHIDGLIAKGYLAKRDKSARSLEVLKSTATSTNVASSIPASKQKWLIDIIESKITELEKTDEPKLLDEVYVLIGALKVLQLEGAYVATKARLTDYLKAKGIS